MSKVRCGSFTSSEIWKLMTVGKDKKSFGAPALDLIEEVNMERRLGRSISVDVETRPLTYGKLMEDFVFQTVLGTEYRIKNGSGGETIVHPEIPYWCGSQDGNKFDAGKKLLTELKCPATLKSFCQFIDSGNIEAIRNNHKSGDAYYWQCVSGAILTGCDEAELLIFCPYISQLKDIREFASNWDGNQNRIAWINFSEDNDLPWLPDGGHYKNLNTFRFDVPQADKDKLTEAVKHAGDMLVDFAEIKEEEKKVMQPNPNA